MKETCISHPPPTSTLHSFPSSEANARSVGNKSSKSNSDSGIQSWTLPNPSSSTLILSASCTPAEPTEPQGPGTIATGGAEKRTSSPRCQWWRRSYRKLVSEIELFSSTPLPSSTYTSSTQREGGIEGVRPWMGWWEALIRDVDERRNGWRGELHSGDRLRQKRGTRTRTDECANVDMERKNRRGR